MFRHWDMYRVYTRARMRALREMNPAMSYQMIHLSAATQIPSVFPSGCLSARAVPHPPAIGISCVSAFFSRRARFCVLKCNSCSKCYGMDCFGTYFRHVQTCNATRVQSATEWTASVHTLDMSKPVMQLVFKVLRNGLLRYIFYTCPNLWCNRVQSATEWTAAVDTLHMPNPVMELVF